jgi:hypothetical protein
VENNLIISGDESFVPGTVKPEEDYKEIERLGQKLGIPIPMTFVKAEAINPDGSSGDKYEGRSRTWNRNFWNTLFGGMVGSPASVATFAAGFLTTKSRSGSITNSALSYSYIFNATLGGINDSTNGIVIGTGSTAESFEGFTLVTQIVNGASAGTMVHTAQAGPTVTYTAGTKTWAAVFNRLFNNNSGGTIIVAETSMYVGPFPGGSSGMHFRDVLASPVPVLNGGQLTVTYTITLAFPA